MKNKSNEVILSLASILNIKKIDKEVILQALKLICEGFSFEYSLLYELGVENYFYLTQQYGMDNNTVKKQDKIEFLKSYDQEFLAEKLITIIKAKEENTTFESKLLNFYNSNILVITPIIDESSNIYGLIILGSKLEKDSFQQLDFNDVSIALSMLMRSLDKSMYEKKFHQMQYTLENILDNAGVDIYVNDFYNHDILYTNDSMAAPYGGKEKFLGQKCWQVLFPGQIGTCDFCPQKKLVDENGNPTKVYSWDYQRGFDGAWFRVFSAAFHWVDGRLAHIVSSADITDNKKNEKIIENLANYDQLTQLPNRRSLIRDCEQRILNATKDEKGYVLFFDIDGFKNINDNYGHDGGDEFLIQLAQFFSEIPLLKNSIYRNGGDEFVALIGGETITKKHIEHLANFIHNRFKKVWKLKNGDTLCNVSLGIACYPEDGKNPDELLVKADKAMYQVKNKGGANICFGYEIL